jgi:hypothetical protein
MTSIINQDSIFWNLTEEVAILGTYPLRYAEVNKAASTRLVVGRARKTTNQEYRAVLRPREKVNPL